MENHIGSSVSEILLYTHTQTERHTEILLLLYKDKSTEIIAPPYTSIFYIFSLSQGWNKKQPINNLKLAIFKVLQ